MSALMRVLASADTTGSGYVRVKLPAHALADDPNVDVVIMDYGMPVVLDQGRFVSCEPIVRTKWGRDVDWRTADLIVLQRPMDWYMPDAIRYFQRYGVAVAVELDDHFHAVHPSNRAFDFCHPKTSPHSNREILMACVRHADAVIVSTTELARKYGGDKAIVVRNAVADEWLNVPHYDDGRRFGWGGTLRNHPTDLPVMRGAASQLLEEFPAWRFAVIGGDDSTKGDLRRHLSLTAEQRDPLLTDWFGTDDLYPVLVARLDVGLVPLDDIMFNRAKSWLKGLEYAALGVPFVASDMPEYQRLADRGLVAELVGPKRKLWVRALRRLMSDREYRIEVSGANRRVVRESLSIGRTCHLWAEAWERSVAMGRRRKVLI